MADVDGSLPSMRDSDLVVDGWCDHCGYALKGLAATGACPECGTGYDRDSMRPVVPMPGALELCVRFGWPVLLMAVLAAGMFADRSGAAFLLSLASLAATPINSAVQVSILMRDRTPPNWRSRSFSARLRLLGAWTVVTFYVTCVVPFVIFGGCVVLVIYALNSSPH